MQLSCPKCGTREVRVSARQGLGETLKSLLGVTQLRCRRCRARWETSVWSDGAWKFARCPRCYRQHLTTWSLQYYRPATTMRWMLQLGATPYRCAACRCNFASFRPCREKYGWRNKTHPDPGERIAEEHSGPGDMEDLAALGRAVGAAVDVAANLPSAVPSPEAPPPQAPPAETVGPTRVPAYRGPSEPFL